jgi:hypothetical protein
MSEKGSGATASATGKSTRPVVEARDIEPAKDLFYVHNADPSKVYFHAEDNPLRIRELQILGYRVCSGKEVGPLSPIAIKDSADSTPLNLPGHVLMETSRENWERLDNMKDARLKQHERDVKDKFDEVKALMQRSGLGKAHARLKDEEIKF